MASRIFLFSIVLGAEYSFYLKSIATYAPEFLVYNNSVLARVGWLAAYAILAQAAIVLHLLFSLCMSTEL